MSPLDQAMNYYAQIDACERLSLLEHAAMRVDPEHLNVLRLVVAVCKRDLFTMVASELLNIDYFDVMPIERNAVKSGLFARAYENSNEWIFRR